MEPKFHVRDHGYGEYLVSILGAPNSMRAVQADSQVGAVDAYRENFAELIAASPEPIVTPPLPPVPSAV